MKEKCPIHVNADLGSCGFYIGYKHGEYPPGKEPEPPKEDRIIALAKAIGVLTKEEAVEVALDVLDWVVCHQATGERVAILNSQQQEIAEKHDLVGMLYLPQYCNPQA